MIIFFIFWASFAAFAALAGWHVSKRRYGMATWCALWALWSILWTLKVAG